MSHCAKFTHSWLKIVRSKANLCQKKRNNARRCFCSTMSVRFVVCSHLTLGKTLCKSVPNFFYLIAVLVPENSQGDLVIRAGVLKLGGVHPGGTWKVYKRGVRSRCHDPTAFR